jgi:hypothetical protein
MDAVGTLPNEFGGEPYVSTSRKESTVENAALTPSPQNSQPKQSVPPRRHRWLIFLTSGLVALLAAALVFQTISLRRLSYRLARLELDTDIRLSEMDRSTVSPESNIIQFLRRGYSIQFEQVAYEPAGLHLVGYFGNPTNIVLHSVSLKFSARKHWSSDEYRGLLEKQRSYDWTDISGWGRMYLLVEPEEIGSAQSPAIDMILPGSTGRFDVTIPNARQAKEGLTLYVSLTGERYSYPSSPR